MTPEQAALREAVSFATRQYGTWLRGKELDAIMEAIEKHYRPTIEARERAAEQRGYEIGSRIR